jgi:CheY-like chemotaxis protein
VPARPPAARELVAAAEEALRAVRVAALPRRGCAVTTASDGEEALRVLRRDAVDAAVLDLHMPLINGYDVIRYVRTDGPQPRLPIVVLTGAVDQLDSLELLGANIVLAKPTDIRRLLMEVEALLPQASAAVRE